MNRDLRCVASESLVFCSRRVSLISFEHLPKPQARQAQELYDSVWAAAKADLKAIVELLATTPDNHFFGAIEFKLRDIVDRIGAKALHTAAMQRKKGDLLGSA